MDQTWIVQELNRELETPISMETLSQWDLKFDPQKEALLTAEEGKVSIRYPSLPHLCRLLGIASERREPVIKETAHFEELSFMVDCSRNAVPRVETVKKLIRRMVLMGYHALMLYTEDTYELENQPYFGYMRGRYSRKELREIDDYAAGFGIEVIPCIQTLAHLNALFHWKEYREIRDTRDILLCDEEKTYDLIRQMLSTCAECFRSRKIHVGMDEAEMLGRGKFLSHNGYEERNSIFLRHLNRVTEICREFDLEPMIWSDMFIKDLRQCPQEEQAAKTAEIRNRIPGTVTLVHWDYYARTKEKYDRSIIQHLQLSGRLCFAGGSWKWSGFAPLLDHSLLAGRLALESCLEHRVNRVMLTAWGDDGAECSLWTALPLMQMYAEVCYSGRADVSEEQVARRLKANTGVSYTAMMAASQLNYVPHNDSPGRISSGPVKYYLYQDPMMGLFDRHVDPGLCPAHFRRCAALMADAAKNGGESHTFAVLEKLALALERKCDFGIRLKQAYDSGNRALLAELGREAVLISDLVRDFLDALHIQWLTESKPQGFEVLDIRVGGVIQRLLTTAKTIELFLDGTLASIGELEEQKLYFEPPRETDGEYPILENCLWREMVTAAEI